MKEFVEAERNFEDSMKRIEKSSESIKVRIDKSRQLNDELQRLADNLAAICEEKGLKV